MHRGSKSNSLNNKGTALGRCLHGNESDDTNNGSMTARTAKVARMATMEKIPQMCYGGDDDDDDDVMMIVGKWRCVDRKDTPKWKLWGGGIQGV